MPFVEEESQNDNVEKIEKRQIVIWSFLAFIVLALVSVLFFISYQVLHKDSRGTSLTTGDAPLLAPISKSISDLIKKPVDNHYFLFGKYFPDSNKYSLNRMFYNTFAKEEVFSFLWHDNTTQPSFSFYHNNIVVFPDINKGYLISPEGKVIISSNDFIPPDSHFSISFDNKYMFYFKYLSSIGTTSLTLRDLEKNEDVFSWPVSSSASQACDFVAWSANNTSAYCLLKNKESVVLKSFDAISHIAKTITSKKGIIDASYQSNKLLTVSRSTLSLYNQQTNEWKDVVSTSGDVVFESALLVPDGSGIVYAQHANNKTASDKKIYFVKQDGSDQREVFMSENGNLVAISPDSQFALFESINKSPQNNRYYFITQIDGTSANAAYMTDITDFGSQFISWSK